MRKILLLLLAGSAAVPAVALAQDMPGDGVDRDQARAERHEQRQQARFARPQNPAGEQPQANGERPRFDRSGGDNGAQPQVQQVQEMRQVRRQEMLQVRQQAFDGQDGGRGDVQQMRMERGSFGARQNRGQHNFGQRMTEVPNDAQGEAGPAPRPHWVRVNQGTGLSGAIEQHWRMRDGSGQIGESQLITRGGGSPTLRQLDRPLPRVMRTRTPVISTMPREGTQPPLRAERRANNWSSTRWAGWSSNWRHSDRYDWRRWRHHHRSIFHLGLYYDPFGWGYQPYSIGWRLWPTYYSSRFWLSDPWQYRLPYAPPGTRWIRYYDDAILVDVWSGEVVDVIYDFFW